MRYPSQRLESARVALLATLGGLISLLAPVSLAQNALDADANNPEARFEARLTDVGKQKLRPDQVYLRSGRLTTPELRRDRLEAVVREADPSTRHLVQLDGPMTPARRTALEEAGVRLDSYLPANAWIARLAGADAEALAELGIIRWAGAFEHQWKIDAELGTRTFITPERIALENAGRKLLSVTLFEGETVDDAMDALAMIDGLQLHGAENIADSVVLTVEMNAGDVNLLASAPEVQFIENAPEITLRNSTNRWIVQSNVSGDFPLYDAGIRGAGQVIGVLDGAVDQNHCSFGGGKIIAYNNTPGASFHGTHVAATAAGDNGVNDDTRGVAYEANLVVHTIPSFTESGIYNRLDLHHGQGARVHTNSWGDDGTTAYNSLCRGFDDFLYDNEESFVCLAVTNTSTLKNPENAKNLLACGASQDTPSQGSFCSGGTGPTSDGRRKPELFAPGCGTSSASSGTACSTTTATGTSMATPAIAGTAALIRQYYTDGFYPSGAANGSDAFTPSGALIKATLLNSAVDMTGISGYPSNAEGWGRVLADNALHFTGETRTLFVEDVRNADGLSTGQQIVVPVTVSSSAEDLRVTLVWTDPAAAAGASFASINNLDLTVESPGGATYLGNVFSGGQSTTGGTADDRNNVEQVRRTSPATGTWLVTIDATAVNEGTQGYALVVSGAVIGGAGDIPLTVSASGPSVALPGASPVIEAMISPNDDTLVPDSPTLHYRYDAGAFQTMPLVNVAGENWEGLLPPVNCDESPEWFVSAEGVDTGIKTWPTGGDSNPATIAVGEEIVALEEDFESPGPGWTTSGTVTAGAWELGVPVNLGRGDPPADYDGSGRCWLTENDPADENSDVDDGCTILTSPAFDASTGGTLSYAYWLDSGPGIISSDFLSVEVATDDPPTNWTEVRNYTSPAFAWRTDSIEIGSEVPATSTLRLRFTACDNGTPSVIECGLDAMSITNFVCTPVNTCEGDANGDGNVDVNDVSFVIFRLGDSGDPGTVDGDADGDGTVDVNDVSYVIFRFGPCN